MVCKVCLWQGKNQEGKGQGKVSCACSRLFPETSGMRAMESVPGQKDEETEKKSINWPLFCHSGSISESESRWISAPPALRELAALKRRPAHTLGGSGEGSGAVDTGREETVGKGGKYDLCC